MSEVFNLGNMSFAWNSDSLEDQLSHARFPDRFNEDWRFGQPHLYAADLAEKLKSDVPSSGRIHIEAPDRTAFEIAGSAKHARSAKGCELIMASIGSDALLSLHLKRFGEGVFLHLNGEFKDPIVITYETDGLFVPTTCIYAGKGAKAHIIERHIGRGESTMFCTRNVQVFPGAELYLELHEEGSGSSRAMNITHLSVIGGRVHHLTTHQSHLWAREETVADILLKGRSKTDVQLYSANRLSGKQMLDQHTKQIHRIKSASSNLLYKNVVDDSATSVFSGNILVQPGAHHTDAYQANRNMLLSEQATAHSLPGLEILADHVRCSHGCASAPMDEDELFYLLSRGIPRHEAQCLVADGFLDDAIRQFHAPMNDGSQASGE